MNTTSADALARRTADTLGVQAFVENWNAGGGSLISDLDDLDMAFSFDEGRDRDWGLALGEAQAHGLEPAFRAAFGALVRPVIQQTFAAAVQALCIAWAQAAASEVPARHGRTTPFTDIADWATWCLAHFEGPLFCRPWGEELIPDAQAEPLIRHALLQQQELATSRGWISPEPHAAPQAMQR